MVDATALGAVVEIRVGSSPSISKFYTEDCQSGLLEWSCKAIVG